MAFQSFDATTRPEDGPPRLQALRERLAQAGLDGFLVPRADAHQGEYIAPHDERLPWLTGFTGSAGFCAVLRGTAGLFVDGRYTLQAAAQVDTAHFTVVNLPATDLGDWLAEQLPNGGTVGFDPWLHTAEQIDKLRKSGEPRGINYCETENFIDQMWDDRPDPPTGALEVHPLDLAGEPQGEKRARIAANLRKDGLAAAVFTLPDDTAWLLNLRGSDIAHNPVPHVFSLLDQDGSVTLFVDPAKVTDEVRAHLGNEVTLEPVAQFLPALQALSGKVRVEAASVPIKLRDALNQPVDGKNPVKLPKARKNPRELKGMVAAHLRDGAAIARFLHWVDRTVPEGQVTEIDVVRQLEAFRTEGGDLREISFDTIAGSGPNGAIIHYRVTEQTNRTVTPGELLLVDSGGQYSDGTTDITRTIATGPVTDEQRSCFTRVLKGMIGISRLRWPRRLAGRDLDAIARVALWEAGLDYDHGTGHGVGAFLSVHEGPQSLSRRGEVPLEAGMILSNEPGYYRAGAFGIRIENLVHVVEAGIPRGGDPNRAWLEFATLTWAPIDRRLIQPGLLTGAERDWLDAYHAEVRRQIGPLVPSDVVQWLDTACRPL